MRTLVAVADRGRLRMFELVQGEGDRTPHLELLETASRDEMRTKLSDQLSDSAGRFPRGGGAAGGAGMSVGERHGIALEHERRAVQAAAGELEERLAGGTYGALWLAAAQPLQAMLLEALGDGARAKLRKALPLDLTKADPGEIVRRFRQS